MTNVFNKEGIEGLEDYLKELRKRLTVLRNFIVFDQEVGKRAKNSEEAVKPKKPENPVISAFLAQEEPAVTSEDVR